MRFLKRLKVAFFILKNGGGEEMVALYVFMITNEKIQFTFNNVPGVFKPQVKIVLEEMGVGELAVE